MATDAFSLFCIKRPRRTHNELSSPGARSPERQRRSRRLHVREPFPLDVEAYHVVAEASGLISWVFPMVARVFPLLADLVRDAC